MTNKHNDRVAEIERIIITKELMPRVCMDSGQAEWTVGEARKLAEAIYASEAKRTEKIVESLKDMTRYAKHWKGCMTDIAGRPHNAEENCICGLTNAQQSLKSLQDKTGTGEGE